MHFPSLCCLSTVFTHPNHSEAAAESSESISLAEKARLLAAGGLSNRTTLAKELVLLFDMESTPRFCFPDGTPDVSANAVVGDICNFLSFTSSLSLGSMEPWCWPKPNHTRKAGNSFRRLLEEGAEMDHDDIFVKWPCLGECKGKCSIHYAGKYDREQVSNEEEDGEDRSRECGEEGDWEEEERGTENNRYVFEYANYELGGGSESDGECGGNFEGSDDTDWEPEEV